MPRPKGSKNKPKTAKATVDFAAQIAEKQAAKEAAAAEIASITANIDALKADLKTKKAELKSIDKDIVRIEAKKIKAETKAAESAKKAEAEDVLKKLLASGVSADDILAKLKLFKISDAVVDGNIYVASRAFVYTNAIFALQNACWDSPKPFVYCIRRMQVAHLCQMLL